MKRILSLLLVCLLVLSSAGMPVMAQETSTPTPTPSDDSLTVEDLEKNLNHDRVIELLQQKAGEISETQYKAVVLWVQDNPLNYPESYEGPQVDEWMSTLSEEFGISTEEVVAQYTSTPDDSDSGSDIDASSESDEETEPVPEDELIDADRVLLNEVRIQEGEHTDSLARITLQNPTTEVQRLALNPSGTDEQVFIRLNAGETREVDVEMSGTLSWSIVVSPSISSADFDEVVEEGGTTGQAQYTVTHDILTINHSPDVGHPIVVVVIGGLMVFLTMFSVIFWDSRASRMAIPVNAPARGVTDKRRDYPDDAGRLDKVLIFVSGWIKGWSLICVDIIIVILGVLAFFGSSPISNTYIAGSTVFAMYGILMFSPPGAAVGLWVARKRFIEIHDINPEHGDNWLWLLSPHRFANTRVFREVEDRDTGERLVFEVDKSWLYSINEDSPRPAFEVEGYDPVENILWVSWSGEAEQIEPHELRRHQRLVPWIQDVASFVIDQYSQMRDFYAEDVRQEAELLNARQVAMMEDEKYEGMSTTRERLKGKMRDRGHGDLIEGNETAVVDEVSEDIGESDPRENAKKNQQERVTGEQPGGSHE